MVGQNNYALMCAPTVVYDLPSQVLSVVMKGAMVLLFEQLAVVPFTVLQRAACSDDDTALLGSIEGTILLLSTL